MDKSLKIRLGLVAAVLIVSLIYVYPSLKMFSLSKQEQAAMDPARLQSLKDKSVKLGLDLQGGMYLVLEVDRSGIPEDQDLKNVVSRAEAIIRNRVDKFGVAEPVIHTEGQDRIAVQLAGLSDEARAKDLVGQTALLEFKLVREGDDFRRLLTTIDDALKDQIEGIMTAAGKEEVEKELERVAAESDTTGLRDELTAAVEAGRKLSSLVTLTRVGTHEDAVVNDGDIETVKTILAAAEARGLIPPDVQILWDRDVEETREGKIQRVYMVARKASITGQRIASAAVSWGGDATNPGAAGVTLEFDRAGKAIFSKVTGANVDRRLAIVLDGLVHSAPNIKEKIGGGVPASISGNFTTDQARDLAIVLEAGALPAPLKIAEEHMVGPSLGSDSIKSGVRASVIGGIATLLFMILFYGLSGVIADVALLFNLVILLAAMGALRGTLTLPGIAGVILSLAMAVDANVIIFERIKEELRAGKTVRKAVQDGYSRAFLTILDSNVTTMISAVVLYQFGTGPIKGFAVTLTIGIAASMFTAILVTRVIFDIMTGTRQLTKLHI
ncbi:MAG: protein translocase subunit SecD [bacterium]